MYYFRKIILSDNDTWMDMENLGRTTPFKQTKNFGKGFLVSLPLLVTFKPDHPVVMRFLQVQEGLRSLLGKEHYFTPLDSFHITIWNHRFASPPLGNVNVPADFNENHVVHWELEASAVLFPIIQKHTPWNVQFHRLIATRDSVIAVGSDTGQMNTLRKELVAAGISAGIYPDDPKSPFYRNVSPKIIYSTLVGLTSPISEQQRKHINETRLENVLSPFTINEIAFYRFLNFIDFSPAKLRAKFFLKM